MIKQLLQEGVLKLDAVSTSPRLDAELLLSHALSKNRAYLYAHPEALVSSTICAVYHALLNQRCQGVPVAYLTGQREFWSLPLEITPATLIPRSETELLVDVVLTQVKQSTPTLIDLGTGSGAIALALAKERPLWSIMAVDRDEHASAVAQKNAQRLDLHVTFVCSDWFQSISPQRVEVIVSNPPYLAPHDSHLHDLRFEPKHALVSEENGLADLKHIILTSRDWLVPGGFLFVEHGYEQAAAVRVMMENAGYEQVECWKDSGGRDRVSQGLSSRRSNPEI